MLPIRLKYVFLLLFMVLLFSSCKRDKPASFYVKNNFSPVAFPFFLSAKTMIINQEQSNELEGHYLKVIEVINDSTFKINLPDCFYLNDSNYSGWMLGWPTGNAYYDAGNENLREIIHIDTKSKQVVVGNILRGNGGPAKNQRVVFWSSTPSGFKKSAPGLLVHPEWWNSFSGKSMEFGTVLFDTISHRWVMYLQEVDTPAVKIYAATSNDLINWVPFKNGAPLFRPEDFLNTAWAGKAADGKTPQTARIYSSIFFNRQWFFFLSGYLPVGTGNRAIGLITCTDPLNGPFTVYPNPIIASGKELFDIKGCFYPKVCRSGNHFLLYYDGINSEGIETVCLAESADLLTWTKYEKNPVMNTHYGWQSGLYTSEPDFVIAKNDSVWVMHGGYKKYNTEFSVEDSLQGKLPMDTSIFSSNETDKGKCISGNVMDAELGVFLSVDGGHTFRPHVNNPIWINNYSDTLQNDHLGGDFYFTQNKNVAYILYQAKSETQKRYNILQRTK